MLFLFQSVNKRDRKSPWNISSTGFFVGLRYKKDTQ